MARWTTSFTGTAHTRLFFDEPTNACWFAAEDGKIWSFRVLGQRLRAFGSGWNDAVAVLPSTDGLHLFVVLSNGDVVVVTHEHANQTDTAVVASIGATLIAAHRLADNTILVLDNAGQVSQVAPSDGTSKLVTALEGATLLAVDDAAGEILLAIPGATSEVYRFDLDGTAVGASVDVAARAVALAPPPQGATGVVVCDDTGAVFHQDWSGTINPFTFTIADVSSICRWHSLFIAAAPLSFSLVEWGDDVKALPITASADPLVSSGWTPMDVDYLAAGLAEDTSSGSSMKVQVPRPSRWRGRQAAGSSIA